VDVGVVVDAIDAVVRIQVFVKSNLEDGGTALATDDGAVGEEKDPNPVPPLSIGFYDVVLIADPVLIPSVNSSRVVNTENINVFYLKTCTFELFWVC
jgi:hypothetical protein